MKPNPMSAFRQPTVAGALHIPPPRLLAGPPSAPRAGSRPDAAGPGTWSTFWRDFGLENEPNERCHIAGDGRAAVDQHWAHFADGLPRGAQVIDLGCGAGILGRTLLSRRSDLRIDGVDWANVPTTRHPNLTLHPGVGMETLPFGNGGFDAAVSLFGIEYGKIEETARELARVLKPGARFSFLVHHEGSETLREGGARRRALRELIAGKMKGAFLTGDIAAIARHRQSLKAQFPGELMVILASEHFRRNVTRTRAERQMIWQKLADDLHPEIALLAHLERSAKSAAGMGAWLVSLLSIMRSVGISVLRRSSGEPIAWDVSGTC